jgi:hypothetical protein
MKTKKVEVPIEEIEIEIEDEDNILVDELNYEDQAKHIVEHMKTNEINPDDYVRIEKQMLFNLLNEYVILNDKVNKLISSVN